jgi:hypothetical protein
MNKEKSNIVLVIGNDPSINEIDFSRLRTEVITLGTNRSWLKHIPDYHFFHDVKIFQELDKNPECLSKLKENSHIITSDWLKICCNKNRVPFPSYAKKYNRPDRYKFVDCVTTAIEILDRYVYKRKMKYYIAGVSLTWKDPSHFWKTDIEKGIGNSKGPAWYIPRFNRAYDNFVKLKGKRFDIVSVTEDSRLNKIFRYESIGNLYS